MLWLCPPRPPPAGVRFMTAMAGCLTPIRYRGCRVSALPDEAVPSHRPEGPMGSWLLASNSWTHRRDRRGHRRNVAAFGSRSPRRWPARRAGDRGGGSGLKCQTTHRSTCFPTGAIPGQLLVEHRRREWSGNDLRAGRLSCVYVSATRELRRTEKRAREHPLISDPRCQADMSESRFHGAAIALPVFRRPGSRREPR
jgi:hypothetical protein